MEIKVESAQKQLIATYKRWLDELKAIAPSLAEHAYSNPYYISIPDGWFDEGKNRIMVVGEEGFGIWGCGKRGVSGDESSPFYQITDFEQIQKFNYDFMCSQIGNAGAYPVKNSHFGNRFRKVPKYGVCCWTNIDKIHKLGNSKCALSQSDRRTLHSVKTKVLYEEIDILKPTHLFFGWHRISLQHELPDLFNKIYPTGLNDKSGWKEATIMNLDYNRIPCLFLYHPAWGNRNNGYEEEVEQAIKNLFLSKTLSNL